MKRKHQRLVLALVALACVIGASLFALSAIGERANFFYSPSDLARAHLADGTPMRLGGMVERGSLKRAPDGVTLHFVLKDESRAVPVVFRGLPPDLFREGSGVVCEGSMKDGTFIASNLLAKHDEQYRVPSPSGPAHRTMTLQSS